MLARGLIHLSWHGFKFEADVVTGIKPCTQCPRLSLRSIIECEFTVTRRIDSISWSGQDRGDEVVLRGVKDLYGAPVWRTEKLYHIRARGQHFSLDVN